MILELYILASAVENRVLGEFYSALIIDAEIYRPLDRHAEEGWKLVMQLFYCIEKVLELYSLL
jgi:hypothetical protein